MDFDAVADEVYAAGRGDFVPVRDERAKQARASGDRALAERIKGLRKPTVAASLLNRLARAGSDDLDRLGRLGEALRDAHQRLDGDRLRELSRERHDLIGELTARVRSLASEDGLSVNDGTARQLEDSFEAALADERAFRELCLGRLAGALTEENSGQWFTAASAPPVKSAEPAKPAQPKPKSARKPEKPKREKEGAAREKKRAEQEAAQQKELAEAREKERAELEAAREKAAATVRARDEARQTQADAESVAEDAAEAVADLRKRLKEAERAERAARKEATAARREAESAARAATEADRELRNLRTKSH